jgi:exodeoxyribonuclease V alpha subunit
MSLSRGRRLDGATVVAALRDWAEKGWIRRLDAALARFVADLCPDADAAVIFAAAVLAQMEGRGHTCVDLEDLALRPNRLLAWSGEAARDLAQLHRRLPVDLSGWIGAVGGCAAVRIASGQPDDAGQPLVVDAGRLYLRRYWLAERRVAAQVARRAMLQIDVDEPRARTWLDRLFPARTDGTVDWQKVACAVALRGGLSVITGGPGTGKTHTAARLLALHALLADEPGQLRIALAAPTGKAAARLKQAIEAGLAEVSGQWTGEPALVALIDRLAPARTLHALLGARPDSRRFRHDRAHPLDVDLLVVDEASMVHLELMADLLDALPDSTRVVLLGDKDQLASVEAGAVLGELCAGAGNGRYRDDTVAAVARLSGERIPSDCADASGPPLAQQIVQLRESRRFGGDIGRLAAAVNAGDADAAQRLLAAEGGTLDWWRAVPPQAVVGLATDGRPGAAHCYADYLRALRQLPDDAAERPERIAAVLQAFDGFRVLCAVRDGPWGGDAINRAIARRLGELGLIAPYAEWYAGRPVAMTRNAPDLGVFNGDVGIALRAGDADSGLRVYFADGAGIRSVSASRLADVETAFAMTVHKAQGSEFGHVALVLPDDGAAVTRELVYTGITRARGALTLVAGDAALAGGIGRVTRRASGLAAWLEQCGLQSPEMAKEAR